MATQLAAAAGTARSIRGIAAAATQVAAAVATKVVADPNGNIVDAMYDVPVAGQLL